MALIEKLNAIGNAIRAKTGGTAKLSLTDMVTAINSITVSGDRIGTLTKTLTATNTATFTGLLGTPKWVVVLPNGNQTLNGTNRYISSYYWNGSTSAVVYSLASGNKSGTNTRTTNATTTYSNGTLTLKTSSTTYGVWYAGSYTLIYGY